MEDSRINPFPEEIERFAGFGKGELAPALAAFAYFFFVIMSYYVLKPIRESLALELGSARIPALNIFSMFSLVFANALYSWIVGRFRREHFIPWITRFFSGCLIGFWMLFGGSLGTAPMSAAPGNLSGVGASFAGNYSRVVAITAYFIWVNVFALFSVSMFWSFANDVFSREQGQRLYGAIGYGGLVGGLFGGILTASLVNFLGTANMFLLAACLLEPSVWCMRFMHNRMSGPDSPEKAQGYPPDRKLPPNALDGLRNTLASNYLILMALEMFVYTLTSTLFSYQVNAAMESALPTRDQRTMYWANIYNCINVLSLATQTAVTWLVMRGNRPWIGLILPPICQLIGSICLLLNPAFVAALLVKISRGVFAWIPLAGVFREAGFFPFSLYVPQYPVLVLVATIGIVRYALNYSTGRAVRELFFTPLSREEKYQAKGFIDTLVFRAGDGIGSAFLLSWLNFFPAYPGVDFSIILSTLASMVLVVKLGSKFQEEIERERAGSVAA